MLSQVMFGKNDLRLRQAKNKNNTMGGISVILIGDFGQLLPLCGSTLYSKKLNNALAISGCLAYEKFHIVITLEVLVRQELSKTEKISFCSTFAEFKKMERLLLKIGNCF